MRRSGTFDRPVDVSIFANAWQHFEKMLVGQHQFSEIPIGAEHDFAFAIDNRIPSELDGRLTDARNRTDASDEMLRRVAEVDYLSRFHDNALPIAP